MSFDGSEFLDLAKELAGKKQSISIEEARLRSAISRAYYAAFWEARKFLQKKHGERLPYKGQAHGLMKDFFVNHSDPNYQSIGGDLDVLLNLRRQADYGWQFTGLSTFADNAIQLAETIVKTLKTL